MDEFDELLNFRVEKVLPSKDGLKHLLQTRKIRLYQGFDPTAPKLHLGHTVGLRKLMEFARRGHEVIFLFGTGTVLVGDPSLRENARDLITPQEIEQNIQTWKDQVKPIVDFSLIRIKANGDWLIPLKLQDIINIASKISAIQLFKRDSFQNRLKKGDTVWYHETMYPLLQGYDSVAMDVDLEIGGTDQEFNMLIGRELQQKINHREKYVLTTPMILGTDGKTMSKTSNNCIFLSDSPNDKYAKVMGVIDSQIISYFSLVTNTPITEINKIQTELSHNQLHPMEAKKRLAHTIVTEWHGADAANQAQAYFETTFQHHAVSDQIPVITLSAGDMPLIDLLSLLNLGVSKSQMRRTIAEGGVSLNDRKLSDFQMPVNVKSDDVLKFGKHTFFKLKINN